jgi:hypothetical protein
MRTEQHDGAGGPSLPFEVDPQAPFELDPRALRVAEFMQARTFLDELVGKTIASATVGHERTCISTTDGVTLVFCGFAGMQAQEP